MHFDVRLIVGRRRERFALACRNRRVARNKRRHDAAERLDTERQRSHVEQQHILHVAGEHAALDSRADRNHFVRIDAFVRVLAEELADELLHFRHPRRSADQHDLVDLAGIDARVGQRLPHRRHRALEQVVDELLEARPRQLHL